MTFCTVRRLSSAYDSSLEKAAWGVRTTRSRSVTGWSAGSGSSSKTSSPGVSVATLARHDPAQPGGQVPGGYGQEEPTPQHAQAPGPDGDDAEDGERRRSGVGEPDEACAREDEAEAGHPEEVGVAPSAARGCCPSPSLPSLETMLLAEDVLLLLTDATTGKPLAGSPGRDYVLAGAVLLDLTALGRIRISDGRDGARPGRLVVVDPSPMGDDVLDDALMRLAGRKPDKPKNLLGRLSKGLRPRLLERLAGRGLVRRTERRVLGLFPVVSWPSADARYTEDLRRGVREVLVVWRTATDREASLISLLHAVDRVPAVLPDTGLLKSELRRRAKVTSSQNFAADAVRRAVEEAVTAAVIAASAAGTVSSS